MRQNFLYGKFQVNITLFFAFLSASVLDWIVLMHGIWFEKSRPKLHKLADKVALDH